CPMARRGSRCARARPVTTSPSTPDTRRGRGDPGRRRRRPRRQPVDRRARVTLLVDHTAPNAPIDPQIIDFDSDTHEVQVSWDGGDDPDLADGSPGSGVAEWRYCYRRTGGEPCAWAATDQDSPTIRNVNP